jgi:hypothetical protein
MSEKMVDVPLPPEKLGPAQPAPSEAAGLEGKWRPLGLLLVLLFLLSFYFLVKVSGPAGWLSSTPTLAPTPPTPNSPFVEVQEGRVVLAGTVLPLSVPQDAGTHQLVDAAGQTLAILMSRKLDLNFTVPGMEVEVSGKVLKSLADGKPLLQVESLKYRRVETEEKR